MREIDWNPARAIFLTLTFLMGFLGLPYPGGTGGSYAAYAPFDVTQAAAQETATCPDGSFAETGEYAKTHGLDYIIVGEPALTTLAQVIEAASGMPKPEEVVKVVLIIPPAEGMPFPMASFDDNDCFLFGGTITPSVFVTFTQELGKQKEADANAVEE